MKLPKLPTTIPSVLGPVPVARVVELREKESGKSCLGLWRSAEREVEILTPVSLPTAWHTYWHEWMHIALYDAGVELGEAEERVCDVIASARVREMLDQPRRK